MGAPTLTLPTRTEDKTKSIPARYSFTFVKEATIVKSLTITHPRCLRRRGDQMMVHPETAASIGFFKFAEGLGPALKVKLVALGVHDADEIERTLTAFAAERNGGLIVTPHAVTFTNRDLIVALAARLRLPALYPLAFYAKAGGLISYGIDVPSQFQQGAGYVDRLLRGAKPADLPVQYPTKFQLVVNLRTAKTLGLAIPESFLLRADEVVE